MEERLTRKELFQLGFRQASRLLDSFVEARTASLSDAPRRAEPALSVKEAQVAFVRPPGAVEEDEFLSRCTQCDDCIRACPHWVIRKAGPEMGDSLAGTPIILPEENPCLMCSDFPCITACESGALRLDPEAFIRIGVARVDSNQCYMAMGQPCDYCMTHCPTRPKSITALDRGAAAQVVQETCTGCGKCAEICPPNAIVIEDRRTAPVAEEAVS